MPFDYLALFPIPAWVLPARLRGLLEPVSLLPRESVEVACLYETDPHGPNVEHVHMLMAVVNDETVGPLVVFDEASSGVVEYSVPAGDEKGCIKTFNPSISGHEYIVAAWGDGSFYTFNLAEKVWMTLGLTPRCVGNDHQRLIYDDLGLPEFDVVEGEISNEFHWESKRNISWKISNEYLRRYLWLRGTKGVRSFYYQKLMPDIPEIRSLMGNEKYVELEPPEGTGWYLLDIREHKNGLLIQVWASVEAVSSVLCPEQSAEGISWPNIEGPMTHARANSLLTGDVYLDDRFLKKYEESSFYDTTPLMIDGRCYCSPSYKGQWSFTDCTRVGRNLVKVSLRELYKAKPDREILHAHTFVLNSAEIAHLDQNAEHIVSKTKRLLDQILNMGDNLSKLGLTFGLQKKAADIVGFSRVEIRANGWRAYPKLCRLAQVAPLDMTQQSFLARCKSLHEIWQCIPNGYLKSLLEIAGCPRTDIKNLASIKLLQALMNIVQQLNANEESIDVFESSEERVAWGNKNNDLAALFLNNDLRIADAHESVGQCFETLQSLGFDTASLNAGYGVAIDFVMDGVISSLAAFNAELTSLLDR